MKIVNKHVRITKQAQGTSEAKHSLAESKPRTWQGLSLVTGSDGLGAVWTKSYTREGGVGNKSTVAVTVIINHHA